MKMRQPIPRRFIFSLMVPLLMTGAGCRTLPDVSPFAIITADLSIAVAATGKSVERELRSMEGGEEFAEQFREAWRAREELMKATVRYAESLVEIVNASHGAAQAAREVADGVSVLASTVGLGMPGASVGVVTDAAAFVWHQIALARGAASLEAALAAAQPAVNLIAARIGDDLASLDLLIQGAAQNIEGAIVGDVTVRSARDVERAAMAVQRELFDRFKTIRDPTDLAHMAADLEHLQNIEHVLAAARQTLEPARRSIEDVRARERIARELIAATSEATAAWSIAHYELVQAVESRRPVSVASLAAAVDEIRTLIRKAREQ